MGALLPCALPYLTAPLLLSFVRYVSKLLSPLLLLCSWGSDAALAWARGRSSARCATSRACLAAYALCSRSLLCSVRGVSMLLCRLRLYCSRGCDAAYTSAHGCSPALSATARGRVAACCSAAPRRYPTPGAIFRVSCAASCFAARGARTSRTPWPGDAPPSFVRLLLGASLPTTLPLPGALLLRVSSFLVTMLPLPPAACGAPLLPLSWPVGAPPPFVQLLVGALLPLAPPLLVAPLLCVSSFGGAVVPPALPRLTCGLSSASCAPARGRCAALSSTAPGRSSARHCPSWLRRRLLPCRAFAWACGRSSALRATLQPSTLGCSFAQCAAFRCYCAGSIAPEVLLSPMPELAGAALPVVRRLVGAFLLVALPLLVAIPLRMPSSGFSLPPPPLLPVGLRRRARLRPWAPFRSLCDNTWALCCPSLRRSWSLFSSACLLSWSLCRLLLLLLVGLCCRIRLGLWVLLRPLCDCSWALCCPPLSVAPVLCVLSFDVAVVPPALPRLRLCYRLSLGLWVLLCVGSWALCCCCGFRLSLWAPLRPSCVARGNSAACLCAAFGCSRAPCAISRGCRATSCSVCLGAPLLLTPVLAGARVPLVRSRAGVLLPFAPPLLLAHLLRSLFV